MQWLILQTIRSLKLTWIMSMLSGPIVPPARLIEMTIKRRMSGPNDVVLNILYVGICHSVVHQTRNEWLKTAATVYPVVPGHENIGRVIAVGNVTMFKVGDIGGIGCMVDSCGQCESCLADREQNCKNGTTFTYNALDKGMPGSQTYGGYSDKMVVNEHFVIRIPPGSRSDGSAPLYWDYNLLTDPSLEPEGWCGWIGWPWSHSSQTDGRSQARCDSLYNVTWQSRRRQKMGAKEVVISTNAEAMKPHAGK